MFRAGCTRHLRSAAPVQASLIGPTPMGPRNRPVSPVNIDAWGGRVSDTPIPFLEGGCATLPLGKVVQQLIAVSNATRASAVAATAIGLDARIVAIRSHIDTRILINPVITETSQPTATSWDCDTDFMYRVVRPRNVTVKYTTVDGDEEEWYRVAAEESFALQRVLDSLDGACLSERLAPCVAPQPTAYPDIVRQGLVSVVPRVLFDAYKGHLLTLVDRNFYDAKSSI
jgi:peptide deformylase